MLKLLAIQEKPLRFHQIVGTLSRLRLATAAGALTCSSVGGGRGF